MRPSRTKRFLKTGHLVPDDNHYYNLEEVIGRTYYHFKLDPPHSKYWKDGWVELQKDGKWYIKIP